MKKLVVVGIALVGFGLCGQALESHAATVDNAESKGVIQFKRPTNAGQIIKPDTPGNPEDIILPEGGGQGAGGDLNINHVPDFNFGIIEMTAGEINANAKVEAYTYAQGTPSGRQFIAPFVQVGDFRDGLNGTSFVLSVSGEPFKNGPDSLTGASITLHEETLWNNSYSGQDLTTRLRGGGFTPSPGTKINLDSGASVRILGTKSGQSTIGSISSLVFDNSYHKNKVYTSDNTVEGVKFNKPAGVAVKQTEYSAKLKWTLEDIPFQ